MAVSRHAKSMWGICFTVSAVLVLLEPIRGHAEEKPASGEVKTCTPQATETEVALSLTPEMSSISFNCGTKTAVLSPANNSFSVKPDCSEPQPLTNLCSGATLTKAGETTGELQTYVLTVPQEGRRGQILYYSCSEAAPIENRRQVKGDPGAAGNKGKCTLKITLEKPPTEAQDDQGKPPAALECKAGTLTATASTEKPVSFKCSESMVLHPENSADVFEDSDGKCAKKESLAKLVDATLSSKPQGGDQPGAKEYTFAVKTPPVHDTALCYKCVAADTDSQKSRSASMRATPADEGKECVVKISVTGTSGASPSGAAVWAVPVCLIGGGLIMNLLYV
ncbi:SAG-related sequence [Besnoitia besnoiti]|uniref:SAG-related sequence n=1 Tax=Besnoitia besnoiti TaxID=94643 RepID=A0A2A9MMA5_BESBE|nr:SAG-related sequence [Besnoitia besnoiti]PFH36913.1 SAG-related sequence [Besnoitia besnoiti]